MNYGSNFLGGSFCNRDNLRAPIQFRRKGQPQHLKRLFFFKNSFPNIEQCIPSPWCLVDQIQVQKPIQIIAIDQMPDHTDNREKYYQHR